MLNKRLFIIVASIIFLQSIGLLYLLFSRPPELELFSVKRAVGDFSQQLSQTHLSSAQKERYSKQFSAQLAQSVEDYSKKHHVVLVNPSFVVTPLNDATLTIENDIAIQMQGRAHD